MPVTDLLELINTFLINTVMINMKQKINPARFAQLEALAKECNLILEEEKDYYMLTSNDIGCADECYTEQDIVDSIKELTYLQEKRGD